MNESNGNEEDGEEEDEVTYVRVYESDAERIHDIKSRTEKYPEAVRRILDGFEGRDRDEE